MCGIAGIWERSGKPVDRVALERMGALLAHRGPDAGGTFGDGEIGLMNRRLSILDLSPAGHQPMGLAERGLWLTYNGEIHNYLELRAELEARGVRFHTGTDTEVVLQAYALWGTACFERFNGMWALAIWDGTARQLVLSRDRFGIKPLYYSVLGDRVCFASEAKAILAIFPEERTADGHEIHRFLAGHTPDSSELTFFRNIKNVLPATNVIVGRSCIRQETYWSFRPGDESPVPEAEERFRLLLADSVRLRMRSDAPVGICLSGGLDSSAIVRLVDIAPEQPLHCFSLKYDDDAALDESAYAAMAARHLPGVVTHWVRPEPSRMVETIGKITWHHDSPTTLRGRFPQWFVMQEAGRHVKVVLDGQGGDELLAGYPRFIWPYILDRLRWGDESGKRLRGLVLDIVSLRRLQRRMLSLLLHSPVESLQRHLALEPWIRGVIVRKEFAEAFPTRPSSSSPSAACAHRSGAPRSLPSRPYRSSLNNALWGELRCEGLPEVLHSEDALSMAFSVESRTPFLDHRVVEFCFSLPFHEKIRTGLTKSILRRSLCDVIPEPILGRRRKLGFPAPIARFLTMESNWGDVQDLLLSPACLSRGVFDRRRLERELRAFRQQERARFRVGRVWRWISLELWFRQFIDVAAQRP
jgi:asparagine synthase (glutamine-hydrolysing)